MKNLTEYFQSLTESKEPRNLYSPIGYILNQDGKRIRPRLVELSTEIFGGDIEKALYPAAAFEMLHNFTLIHDDIMDNAPIRRGKATVYKKWNSNIAILSGDALANMALQQLLETPTSPEIILKMIDVFAKTSLRVCEGQQYDLDFENQKEVTIDEYIYMIRLKTAEMLAGCLEVGAILSETSDLNRDTIYNLGINIGIAFQLEDDVLDLYSDEKTFGKVHGGDIFSNKKTFLYLMANNLANLKQKEVLNHYFSSTDFDREDKLQQISSIYNTLHVKENTEKYIAKYLENSKQLIEKLQITADAKNTLLQLASELTVRIK